MSVIITPSHTCGPLFGFALLPSGIDHAVPATDPHAIVIEGTVLDGHGQHLNHDAFLEFWSPGQACRARTLAGRFRAVLARPEPQPLDGAGLQAPHVHIALFARGITRHLVTRMYFPQDADMHRGDPVLQSIDPGRRSTLVARRTDGAHTYRFDICLQGVDETVFFDTRLL